VILSFHENRDASEETFVSERKNPALTRREFATVALLTGAAATLAATTSTAAPLQSAATPPPLSSVSQSESTLRLQTVLSLNGSRFSEDQTADLKKICNSTQTSLDHLRSYKTENSDDPALHLKPLIEHEKKTAPDNNPQPSHPAEKP
jgi:hypothetical protein